MRVVLLFLFALTSLSAFSQLFDKSIEGGITVTRSFRSLNNSNGAIITDDIIQVRNSFEEPINSYGAFLGYTQNIRKRVFFKGELKYQRLGYATNLIQNRRFGGNGPPPSLSLNFIDVYHIASLNIGAGYVFIRKKKTNVYINGGIGVNFMVSNYIKTKTNSNSASSTIDLFSNRRRINTSGQFSLGVARKISQKSALRFELEYSRNLLNFNTDPIGLQLVYASLNIGYVFSLDAPKKIITPSF